ncbi:Crp/Fnr family transcriptional regulator [Myxosarcina sp. GI1(2024)]
MSLLTVEQLPLKLQQTATHRTLVSGQIFFQQHEATKAVFILETGRIRLVSFSQQQIVTHYYIEAGESFAETALFSDTYACSAIAELPSRVTVIDKELLRQALRDSFELADLYMRQLSDRFETVKTLLELRSIRSARERLLQYLTRQQKFDRRTVVLQRPLKDLATELNLSPEAVSRTLSRLQEEGIITRKPRSITLNDDWSSINND